MNNPLLPKLYNNPNMDIIAQEDPNASMGPYPSQIDYYGNPIQEQVAQTQKLLNQFNELKSKPKDLPTPVMEEQTKEEPKTIQAAVQTTEPEQSFKYSQSNLEDILKNREGNSLTNALLRAGMMANQGIARFSGADVKPDEGALGALQKQSDVPLENFSTGLKASTETENADPNSDISKFARERAKEMMKKLNLKFDVEQFNKMSAAQLEKLGFKFAAQGNKPQVRFERVQDIDGNVRLKAFDVNTGEEVRDLGTAGFANQFRIDPNSGNIAQLNPALSGAGMKTIGGKPNVTEAPIEQKITRKDLDPNSKKLLDATREKLSSNDQYKAAQEAIDAAESVDSLLKAGKVQGDIVRAIQNKLARATGEKGAMTENDVAPFGGSAALFDRMARIASIQAGGKIPDSDRQFLSNVNKVLRDSSQRNINQVNYQFASQLADDTGLSLKQSADLLNAEQRLNQKELNKELDPKVRVKSPDGRVGTIPKKNLEAAKKNGYIEVP